jgi:hypothetical protein
MLWLIKNKAEVYCCLLLCIDLVRILWQPADSNECVFHLQVVQQYRTILRDTTPPPAVGDTSPSRSAIPVTVSSVIDPW